MRNLLELITESDICHTPWKHLLLHGVELPTVNWNGGTRRVFNRRFDLLDRVPSIQGILMGQPLLSLLDTKFGPLEFDEHLTYYFIDREGYGLGPHTDVKEFTMIFYQTEAEICLCRSPLRQRKGRTPWYNMTEIVRMSMHPGDALLFKPSDDTWHGVRPTENSNRRSVQHFYIKKGTIVK